MSLSGVDMMLLQLEIHNVALIDSVAIEFGSGLNILTGETGAGKSIIIDSINALLGDRLSRELIRTGTDKASVEAVFSVDNKRLDDIFENLGIESEEDGTLIISREFSNSGKNICRVNGKMVTVSALKEIGTYLIDIHGQHDNQSLLRPEYHIDLLDAFGGERILQLKQEFSKLLSEYRGIRDRIKELSGDKTEREKKLEFIKFQINEIKKAKLKQGEEEELNSQKTLLANSEKIISAMSRAYDLLLSGNNIRNSAADNVNEALTELDGVARFNKKYDETAKKLQDISYQLYDIIDEIRKTRDDIEFDPGLLEQIEERLDLIYRLKRKYGGSIGEILECCEKLENELELFLKNEEEAEKLEKHQTFLNNSLLETGKLLNMERRKSAELLEANIGRELDDLEMKGARFKVNIEMTESAETRFYQNGLDKVEFMISPNVGEALKPLSKIASGGEMSRIMLAIKTILADVDNIPTLIFDEIDIGISGRASQKVGEKLAYISGKHQVICVTHLAQIACMADSHYMIEKSTKDNNTKTNVRKLAGEGIRNEIARIIGGANISEITIKHAEEMLSYARKIKTR
jgi:DNA repair protein RecN (Recombination protein N)